MLVVLVYKVTNRVICFRLVTPHIHLFCITVAPAPKHQAVKGRRAAIHEADCSDNCCATLDWWGSVTISILHTSWKGLGRKRKLMSCSRLCVARYRWASLLVECLVIIAIGVQAGGVLARANSTGSLTRHLLYTGLTLAFPSSPTC